MARKNTTVWVWRSVMRFTCVSRLEPGRRSGHWSSYQYIWLSDYEWAELFRATEPPVDGDCYQCDLHDLIDGNVVWRKEDA